MLNRGLSAINACLVAVLFSGAHQALAQHPSIVGAQWTLQQALQATSASVALSGDTLLVGAPSQGVAYVFVRNGGVWNLQQELTPSDSTTSDEFGNSVALDGNTAVIGAVGNQFVRAVPGAAYVFTRSGGEWKQQQKLTASDGVAGDLFGVSVAVSGNTAVIGADNKTINAHTGQGAVYVFVRNSGVWGQHRRLTDSGVENEHFGSSVAVSGDTAVVGAPRKNFSEYQGPGGPFYDGAAIVFVRSGGVWSEQQELTEQGGTFLGFSVALDGNTVVIGGYFPASGYGSAYAFVRSGLVWTEQPGLKGFGSSVSVHGDTAVVGSVPPATGKLGDGSATLFFRFNGYWYGQPLAPPEGASLSAQNNFGISVSTNGDTAVVAASTAAYVFVH